MKIFARGQKIKIEELKAWFSSDIQLDVIDDTDLTGHNLASYDLIFDLDFDTNPKLLQVWMTQPVPVIVGAVQNQLAKIIHDYGKPVTCNLYGMNTLPTFINRNIAELSAYNDADKPLLENVFSALGKKIHWVQDRVGMVTPRVVCMIINEACYTLQEGTASVEDIDISMKLGTNYPYGPFEWCDRIGISHVYAVLDALYTDTRDDRYKICPLLKSMYLRRSSFYKN